MVEEKAKPKSLIGGEATMDNVTEIIIRNILADDYFFESDQFTDAVESCINNKIENAVEENISNLDFNQMIKDEMPSYDDEINELTEKVEDLQSQLDTRNTLIENLASQIEDLNNRLNQHDREIASLEIHKNSHFRWLFNLTGKLCSLPIIGRYFNSIPPLAS
jgi:predicted RNase H-like nuclease (RuvC/YqgF family)